MGSGFDKVVNDVWDHIYNLEKKLDLNSLKQVNKNASHRINKSIDSKMNESKDKMKDFKQRQKRE